MRVLSLFDGMACGMLAFNSVGVEVESYDAYEIDKYAIKTATYNFPQIKQNGNVFTADFTKYKGVDFLIGGSPCTYWSIAQKKNRETEASGIGWELFSQYVRAIKEAQPKYFIYENNYSMSAAIRESIDKAFGFEAVYINSALVSAQNRKRLYWVGKRNADGSYSRVYIARAKNRGVILKEILENGLTFENVGECETITNAIPKLAKKYGYLPKMFNAYNLTEIVDKSPTLSTGSMATSSCATTVFEKSGRAGGYEVKDGFITIKGKQYPIKLADGFYIIRKLTVNECKRLQTVPEWYAFPVSNAQAYKMLGNGWTIEVIAHLIKSALANKTTARVEQLCFI